MDLKFTGTVTVPDSIFTPPIPVPPTAKPLFVADFNSLADGLITSEYAFWNPNDINAKRSADWEMTSGSLFAKALRGYSGVPNDGQVDIASAINNSRVFRLTTKRKDFLNVSVKTQLIVVGQSSDAAWPPVSWDGIHIFLRYQTEFDLYYASINRRDGKCIIKKKRKDGPKPENGGTYTELGAYTPHAWMPNTIQNVQATIKNQADGTVLIALLAEGKEIMHVIDDGKTGIIDGSVGNWGSPIVTPGAVGIRGDNTEFYFDNFQVDTL